MVKVYKQTLSKYFSYFSSCKYYPTCSDYFRWNLDNGSIFRAIIVTIFRLLRCNEYFKGGFDYPKIKLRPKDRPTIKMEKFKLQKIKYWLLNIKGDSFIVVKSFVY